MLRTHINRISDEMVCELASRVIDCGFEPWLG
jgi:hypothetical protein